MDISTVRKILNLIASKEYKDRHRELGLCQNCSRVALRGLSYCLYHLLTHRVSAIKYRNQRKKELANKEKERRGIRLAEGKCIACGAPLLEDEIKYCVSCKINRLLPMRLLRSIVR